MNKPVDDQGVLGTLAGFTGGVLGIMSGVVTVPIALAVTGIGAVGLGIAGALSSRAVGGLAMSASDALKTVEFDIDMKRREYRDKLGELHHHTHTYMRDHADE